MENGRQPLRSITPREASIYACLVDTLCEPGAGFPEVRDTSAVAFLDEWLTRAPAINRLGFRGLLYAAEIAPRLTGFGARLRRLGRNDRQRFVHGVESSRAIPLRQAARLARVATSLGYFGDLEVMRMVGYDPEAKVARGQDLREREGRP